MYSVFSSFFRRNARSAFPAFLLICLTPWGSDAATPPSPAPAQVQTQNPIQPAERASAPADMQRIYVFDSMDSSITPMLCRPENPAAPVAKEGRLGVKTGTSLKAAPTPAPAPAPALNAGMVSSPAFSPAADQAAPSSYSPASALPSPDGGKIVPTPLEQEIQTIWKYYARRSQAYLPRGDGPLWGPSPDPAARKQVPGFSRTSVRASAPASGRPAPKATPVVSQAPAASVAPAAPAAARQEGRNPHPGETAQGIQASPAEIATPATPPAQSAEPIVPPVSAPRTPSALAPTAGSASLPAPTINAAPQLPAPTVPASRSLSM